MNEPCPYCSGGARTGLPGNACENCMNTGLKYPEKALMKWDIRKPATEAEAVDILKSSIAVLFGQIEYYRNDRKRSWDGDFVNHVNQEARDALDWLALRHPPGKQH